MKKIWPLMGCFILSWGVVFLSPLLIKYPKMTPLNPGSPTDDTITHIYSGFPIPYIHRTNLGMGIDFNGIMFCIDM